VEKNQRKKPDSFSPEMKDLIKPETSLQKSDRDQAMTNHK